ncbi:hypothetical protein [Nocardioides currus]|uniref:DUF4352 domain-containing protein n=1 Tax=Nocardioides currus TaxID=2133958 RepID=A0A2R7YVU5_9ACTN|nr:hypothetical protein [Nocardioides currus]PUA80451.1 hypothetical protein C7S10_15135 [Nocardioides currus]
MLRATVLTLVLACAVASCASDDPEPDAVAIPDASDTPTATAAPTEVAFGEEATVSWAPTSDLSGELSIRVDRVREGDFRDFRGLVGSGITADNQPYYVDVVVTNEGAADLGGLDVPLYLADSAERLSPPWRFASPFGPCDSGPLPDAFATGDQVKTCLVFFASPGADVESITFHPTLETAPVTWSGDVAVPTTPKKQGKRR